MKYVNAYAVSREYGGPEEGGWYFDLGTPLASVPVKDDANAEFMASYLRETIGWESDRPRSSVLGGADFMLILEDHMAERWPKEWPRYE